MTEIERLEQIRFFLKKNKGEFASLLGYKHAQTYTKLQNGNLSISIKLMQALKNIDERISIDWLLWGQGNMLLPQSSIIDSKTINGDHTQATVTGDITNTKNTTSSNSKHIELLEERIKDKEALLENNKLTMSLYRDRIDMLEKELKQLKEKLK